MVDPDVDVHLVPRKKGRKKKKKGQVLFATPTTSHGVCLVAVALCTIA